jgi:hypothetical protein
VRISREHQLAVAEKGEALKLEGIRAELAVVRTARCAAAWENRAMVEDCDIAEAWELCLGYREHEHPDSRSPSSPPPPIRSEKPSQARVARTSPAPVDSQRDSEKLLAPRTVQHEELLAWWNAPSQFSVDATHRSIFAGFSENPRGPIAWLESVAFSFRSGWVPRKAAFRLRYRLPSAGRNLWCFLDASRSTGMSRFLDSARDAMIGLAKSARSARFHLLILEGGQIRWRTRNATASRFEAALRELKEASGKSLIVEGMKTIQRAMLRKGRSSGDRVVLASDGLASPAPAEKPPQTRQRLRHALDRIVRVQKAIAWLHPPARRGLARWLPALCSGLNVRRMEISPEAGVRCISTSVHPSRTME